MVKKTKSPDACLYMKQRQKYYTKWKKPGAYEDKDCVLLFLWMSRKDKSRDQKETGGCLRWEAIAHQLWFLWADGNAH